MARTNIDIDESSCRIVMHRYHLCSKKDAVNMALRLLASEVMSADQVRAQRGTGWEGDLDILRSNRIA